MYQVIATEKALADWLESQGNSRIKEVLSNSGAILHLKRQLKIMDNSYGKERDIEKDLGGYMIILFGKDDEVQNEHRQILHYHHLKENEFEYQESFSIIGEHISILVRLYLCSSDYNVTTVSINL